MNRSDIKILTEFADAIRLRFPDAKIWAYGSRVSGTANEISDLDICVILDEINESIDKIIMDIAWETGFSYDVVISTVTYSKEAFEKGPLAESLFVKSIIDQGIAA